MTVSRRMNSDEGFTLTELIVVVVLLGIVLAGAWALFNLGQRGSAQSNREAWLGREVGVPLLEMERVLSQQAPGWESSVFSPYVIAVRTDRNRDDVYEYYRFEATTDGRIVQTLTGGTSSGTTAWSTVNRNRAASVPMFTYYDIDGTDISGAALTHIRQYAASVKVTIVTEYDGKQVSDSRQVFFRNR